LVKIKLVEPIKVFPDSTETYLLDDFIKFIKLLQSSPATVTITDKHAKQFSSLVYELKKQREKETKTKKSEKKQIVELMKLAKQLRAIRNVAVHQQNKILNTRIIKPNQYRVRKETKHKLTDVILYLFFAGNNKPIHGRISFIKQIFLTIKEILREENVENPKFVPYRYGPYSFLITHILDNLEYDGLIQVKGRKNTTGEKFSLTETGKKVAEKKFSKLPNKIQEEFWDRRRGWDEDHVRGILAYVYNKYPEYTEKSKIKNRYKSITWGRARG